MRRLWMVFCQAVTVSLAVLFVLVTLKPDWIPRKTMLGTLVPMQGPALPTQVGANSERGSSFSAAARKALPAVVHIYTSKAVRAQGSPFSDDPIFRHFFGDRLENPAQRRTTSLGSGVIVSSNGYILTNNHVVEQADEIEIALHDGQRLAARVVGRDPESDLAVLRVSAENLQAITFAKPESMQVGDVVLAIGNPFGVGQTVTMGIISALGRSHLGINTFEDFIQTDAAINPGNSGGALVDAEGNLVGVNSAIYSRSGGSLGIGFAIPVSIARSVMEQIIRTGAVTRGMIGIEVRELTKEQAGELGLGSSEGVLITGVVNGSPAEKAGIEPGDLLQAIGGKPVRDAQLMLESIASMTPGDTARIELLRGTKAFKQQIAIGRRPLPERE